MSTLVQRLRDFSQIHQHLVEIGNPACAAEHEMSSRDLYLAADLIERLRGERAVFAEVMDEAAGVLHTMDGESDEEDRRLRDLQARLEQMALHIRRGWENHDA